MEWYEIMMVILLAVLIIRVVVSPYIIVGLAIKQEEPIKIGGYAFVGLLDMVFAIALYLTLVST